MTKGKCLKCGERVEIDGGPPWYHKAHAAPETHRGDGECLECPIQCGPVEPDLAIKTPTLEAEPKQPVRLRIETKAGKPVPLSGSKVSCREHGTTLAVIDGAAGRISICPLCLDEGSIHEIDIEFLDGAVLVVPPFPIQGP